MAGDAKTSTHSNEKNCYHFWVVSCGVSLRKFPPNVFVLKRVYPLLNFAHSLQGHSIFLMNDFQLDFNEKYCCMFP